MEECRGFQDTLRQASGPGDEKEGEGAAEIVVYFDAGVPDDTKVTFIKYVHEHLLARAQPREEVTRVRTYVCPTAMSLWKIAGRFKIAWRRASRTLSVPSVRSAYLCLT